MSTGTTGMELAIPIGGIKELEEAFRQSMRDGKYTLLAPDGRIWQHTELIKMLAVVAALMRNDELTRDLSNITGTPN